MRSSWLNTAVADQRPLVKRPVPKNKLSESKRDTILKLVNQPEFKNLTPRQIVARLADEGVYITSESTLYRVLKEGQGKPETGS